MWRESRGRDPGTIGDDGEIGIMQVTPSAMDQVGYYLTLDSSMADQANAGVAYFVWLRVAHPDKSIFWAIRAYNAGPGGANAGRGTEYLWKVLMGL
jgi:soluble lytic murein transglycosylase-like protein